MQAKWHSYQGINQEMNRSQLANIIHQNRIDWSAHALERMLEKGISRASVKNVISEGEMIEKYPDSKPFPSGLFCGTWNNKALHAVIAHDLIAEKIFVITAYWPDEEHFEEDFRTRKKR